MTLRDLGANLRVRDPGEETEPPREVSFVTVSLPPEAADDFDRLAAREGRNRSELFREMLGVYQAYVETQSFESLQRYGAAQAFRRGIKTERDVERLIQDSRA